MKFRTICKGCPTLYVDELVLVEQHDDGLYHFTCPQGHENVISLQNFKFELLLDSGGMALLDGYKYEAVSSIAASFERFLEFYINVIVRKHGLSLGDLEKTWKLVGTKSERQIGSFLFVYLLENKRSGDFIEEKWFAFRNKVIHKGYIPSTQEVMDYAERIFRFIRGLLNDLKATSQDAIEQMAMELNRGALSIQHISTMICHTYPPHEGPQSFREGLAHVKDVKPRAYGG